MAGSDSRANGHNRLNDSAATARQKALAEELGIDTYARYPRELIEFRMDRPPKDEAKRAEWKPIHGPKARVYATYMRYSWCWPICLPYAVVTDDRDEILRDQKGRPLVLSEDAVADILGYSRERVNKVVLDLIADKLLRAERAPNREHSLAVFLEPRPTLTEEDRRVKSTLDATGLLGPRLEPAVLRRFINLFNQLGQDDRLINVPANALGNGHPQEMSVRDYRTLAWKQVLDARTLFLTSLKSLRYSERNAYGVISTHARNLMGQTQSPDLLQSSSSSRSVESSASATTTKTSSAEPKANGTAETPREPAAGEGADLQFRDELQAKFRGAHKPVPTARQCTQTWEALQEARLSTFGFLDFLAEPGKLKRIDHPGALPALVTEFGETAVIDLENRRRRDARAAEIAKQSERDWEEIVAEHRSTLADPEASEEDKSFARKILGEVSGGGAD